MLNLAQRLSQIQPSPTLALNAKATLLKSQGIDIINFAAGEPDFETPKWIQEAAIKAMEQGLTKYTPSDGLPILKKAIQEKLKRDYNLDYHLSEITVGVGGKQIIFNALLASLDYGDEVIIPAPYWVSYPDIVTFFDGKPVFIPCKEENGFKMTPEQLENAITSRTKWLILNSPCNPTGAVYTKDELKALAAVLMKYPDVLIMSDDIYEPLMYDGEKFFNIVRIEPRLKFRTLIINGVSKAYSMTGWRIGFGTGPEQLIKALNLLQSQSTSNACSIAQAAAAAAFSGPQDFLQEWRESFVKRRDLTREALNKIEGLSCLNPHGAFYLYVNCQGIIGKVTPEGKVIASDQDFCAYLLENAHVAAVSGNVFGLSPYFRISYATSKENLEEGCKRIAEAVSLLKDNDHAK